VIIGKNDFRKWMQGVSHAASSVLSDLSLGKLVSKIKFKVSLTFPLIKVGCDGWLVGGSE
jgi:hypothetical protein